MDGCFWFMYQNCYNSVANKKITSSCKVLTKSIDTLFEICISASELLSKTEVKASEIASLINNS